MRTVDLAPFATSVIPDEKGLLSSEKVMAPVPVFAVAVIVSTAAAPNEVVIDGVAAVRMIRGLTVITTLNAVDELSESVAVTDSTYVAAVVVFVAASDGSRTITAELAVDVSSVMPEIVGARVNVLFPVPDEAVNGADLVASPCVVTTETEAALAEGWRELPVGEFTLVTIRANELESVILASELTEVNATRVVLFTVTKPEGVKLAALVDVPVYRALLSIVKLVI